MATRETRKKSGRKVESDHLKRDDHLRREQIRQEHIATAAYFKAKERGFSHGMDMQDWLDAEAEYEEKHHKA